MTAQRSHPNRPHESWSFQSPSFPGQLLSPSWDTRNPSPAPRNPLLSQAMGGSLSSDFIDTQELRSGVIDLMEEAARKARQRNCHNHSEDPNFDGIDAGQ